MIDVISFLYSLLFLLQPTPYVSDPTQASTTRCKRRWNDLQLLRLDALAPSTYVGNGARFSNKSELYSLVRERYLLFVKCVESTPGNEPKHPYLYPQPTVSSTPKHH